jgi:hypothetical protein
MEGFGDKKIVALGNCFLQYTENNFTQPNIVHLGEIYNPLKMQASPNIILEIPCYLTKGNLVMRLAYFVIDKTYININLYRKGWPTTDRVEIISHERRRAKHGQDAKTY